MYVKLVKDRGRLFVFVVEAMATLTGEKTNATIARELEELSVRLVRGRAL